MPYINLKTNTKIDKEKEIKIKERLGNAIQLLNKTEDWLMIDFTDQCNLYFAGNADKLIAYVDIKIWGQGTRELFSNMTLEVTKILQEELGIDGKNVYVSYGEFEHWGWNGSNF